MVSVFGESRDLVFSPSRSDLVAQRCFFAESTPRNLAFGHGFRACSSKDKRKKLHFQILGSTKPKQKTKNKMKTNDEIGQTLVSGALDDTKTIGKDDADIFENFGAETP